MQRIKVQIKSKEVKFDDGMKPNYLNSLSSSYLFFIILSHIIIIVLLTYGDQFHLRISLAMLKSDFVSTYLQKVGLTPLSYANYNKRSLFCI